LTHVRADVDNIEEHLVKKGKKLQAKSLAARSYGYQPEVDTNEELDAMEASY